MGILKCPKCESIALTATITTMPHTSKKFKRVKCLKCGFQFDMSDENVQTSNSN